MFRFSMSDHLTAPRQTSTLVAVLFRGTCTLTTGLLSKRREFLQALTATAVAMPTTTHHPGNRLSFSLTRHFSLLAPGAAPRPAPDPLSLDRGPGGGGRRCPQTPKQNCTGKILRVVLSILTGPEGRRRSQLAASSSLSSKLGISLGCCGLHFCFYADVRSRSGDVIAHLFHKCRICSCERKQLDNIPPDGVKCDRFQWNLVVLLVFSFFFRCHINGVCNNDDFFAFRPC
jgi:hypothetical protein